MAVRNPKTPTLDDDLISVQQAADRCHVHYRTVRRWIAEGRIHAIRVGPRLMMINPADLDKLVRPVGSAAR